MAPTNGTSATLFDSGRMFYGRTPRRIFAGVYLLLAASFAGALVSGAGKKEPIGLGVIAAASVLIAVFSSGYSRIRLTEDEIVLTWLPLYRSRIPLSEIRSASAQEIRGLQYGFGLRVGTFGLGLIQDTGPAVRLNAKHGYVLSLGTEERRTELLAALSSTGVATILT